MSAEFCGCDREANWICESHRAFAEKIGITSIEHPADRFLRWLSSATDYGEWNGSVKREVAEKLRELLKSYVDDIQVKLAEAFDDAVKQENKRVALMAALADAGLVAGELSNGRFKIYKGTIRPT